jgi:hypothetical protein
MNCPADSAAEACIFYFTLGKILSNHTDAFPNAITQVTDSVWSAYYGPDCAMTSA